MTTNNYRIISHDEGSDYYAFDDGTGNIRNARRDGEADWFVRSGLTEEERNEGGYYFVDGLLRGCLQSVLR